MPKPTQKNKRVQVPAMYLHPDTLRVIEAIKNELAVASRAYALDELARRYQETKRDRHLIPA